MPQEWIWGLVGGVMIGLAGAAYLLVNGRIMGISGIFGGLVDGTGEGDRRESLAFVAGLVLVPGGIGLALGAQTHLTGNLGIVAAAGLLVGLGTRLANGCTSGHGVCGISRLSLRSIVATVFYVLAGGVTMAIFRQGLGWL